ncbi:hypothetical protein [Comamonas testosteroni]|uniref:hypothetical protein n=1 Tax=Comamonas testosteroni TaxID=285 RepID=UPI0015F86C5A|nr:hypothetical protein [Comamonas testosteroni]
MTKSTYRAIVLASMLIPVAGLCLDSFYPLIPASLKSVYDSMAQFGGIKSHPPGVWLAMAVVTVTMLVSFYGQLRFRNWAPSLAVSSTLACLLVSCFTGPVLQSGLGSAVASVGTLLSGMALILPYACADVRALFWPQAAAATVDTAGHQAAATGPV